MKPATPSTSLSPSVSASTSAKPSSAAISSLSDESLAAFLEESELFARSIANTSHHRFDEAVDLVRALDMLPKTEATDRAILIGARLALIGVLDRIGLGQEARDHQSSAMDRIVDQANTRNEALDVDIQADIRKYPQATDGAVAQRLYAQHSALLDWNGDPELDEHGDPVLLELDSLRKRINRRRKRLGI